MSLTVTILNDDKADPEQAVEIATKIKKKHPDNPTGFKLAAMARAKQGDNEAALSEIRAGLAVAPDDEGLQALEKLFTKKLRSPFTEKSLKDKAESLLTGLQEDSGGQEGEGAGRLESSGGPEAAALLASAKLPPQTPSSAFRPQPKAALEKTIVSAMRVGDFRSAERYLSKKIARDPPNWLAHRLRATARYETKDYEGAVEDATRAIELNPRDGWSYKFRALAGIALERYNDAGRDIGSALSLDPRDADAYHTRAVLWERLDRVEEQLADLKRAADLDPAFKDIYRQALARHRNPPDKAARTALALWLLYGGAAALCLLCFGFVLLRKRGLTTARERAAEGEDAEESVTGFDIVRKLGQGGMGEVYEAVDRGLERRVAIKKMRAEIAGDPRARKRFLKEARTVAALKHPNIIEIHSIIEEGGGLYLVFEHVPGDPMDEAIARRRALPLGEAVNLTRQVGRALDYAHSRGVIHQDLKPANIMVSDGTAKVMDFGIARRVAETLSTLSRGEVAGTPAYMSPEQERGGYQPESDVYALGVCFYEMLTGRPPFTGVASLNAKLQRAYVPLSRLVPGLPPAVDAVLDQALEPDVSRRFHTAADFVAALEKAAA
ncbi:MAG: protein kinase [Elusimicrobiota bacterium]